VPIPRTDVLAIRNKLELARIASILVFRDQLAGLPDDARSLQND
jgi:hypothetical protein